MLGSKLSKVKAMPGAEDTKNEAIANEEAMFSEKIEYAKYQMLSKEEFYDLKLKENESIIGIWFNKIAQESSSPFYIVNPRGLLREIEKINLAQEEGNDKSGPMIKYPDEYILILLTKFNKITLETEKYNKIISGSFLDLMNSESQLFHIEKKKLIEEQNKKLKELKKNNKDLNDPLL